MKTEILVRSSRFRGIYGIAWGPDNKLPAKYSYLLILLTTVFITWETNVNQIIAYASRAVALYYMFPCVVALVVARQDKSIPKRGFRMAGFGLLAVICFLVFMLNAFRYSFCLLASPGEC